MRNRGVSSPMPFLLIPRSKLRGGFIALTGHRPSRKAYHERNLSPWFVMASDDRRGADECEVPPLDIGVRAIQLSPYRTGVAGRHHTRLLLPPAFQPCSCPLALSGLGQAVASESLCLELRPPPGAIRSVRTTAHSFPSSSSSLANAPCGTRWCHGEHLAVPQPSPYVLGASAPNPAMTDSVG